MAKRNDDLVIAAILCKWCSYAGADLAGTSRVKYPENVRVIKVPCSGRVSPRFAIKALYEGADGVLISGCHPGDCHYSEGNMRARRRMFTFKTLTEFMGIEEERIQMSWVSASEAAKWKSVVEDVLDTVNRVGRNIIFEDGNE
ncbi:methyl-viologen-reducing hydrogenase subunit delta [Candidatus Woesearchaeota archaeon CG11_big_fil_rev_8_21_14_0_20_43_8]|nr:MAG: methyl-viologen-reducing hydrogenase subunit delta [Candidatus Woesearchaeota archaeon CG11_big_fil_rev_8_21_14_0_20_43_8]PIO09013.1 MAG: hydrogenase iron-sulfur subunit [Candidatus Woesearchaeota archaeon CG08_land_8_20_14_0_20_43_7]